jgi:hypothetical protein
MKLYTKRLQVGHAYNVSAPGVAARYYVYDPATLTPGEALWMAELNTKHIDYDSWKQGREAQHIVPDAVGLSHNYTERDVMDVSNGMMLIAGRLGAVPLSAAYYNHKIAKYTNQYLTANPGASLANANAWAVDQFNTRRVLHVGYNNSVAHNYYNHNVDNIIDMGNQAAGAPLPLTDFSGFAREAHKYPGRYGFAVGAPGVPLVTHVDLIPNLWHMVNNGTPPRP